MKEELQSLRYKASQVEKWLEDWQATAREIEREWKMKGKINEYKETHLTGQQAMLELLLEDVRAGEV